MSVRQVLRASNVGDTYDNVATSRVGRSIGREVDVGTLELLGLAVTAHRDHALPATKIVSKCTVTWQY